MKILQMVSALMFMQLLTARAETPPETIADSSRVQNIDEIVIVSQPKENLLLRRSPLSSTAFGAADLSALQLTDLRDVSRYVPSFTMPAYGSRYTSALYVRGIGARENSAAVGLYVDGLPLVSKSQYNTHLYDTERIDVLRGPQGTLYGMNTEGGLIRVYSRNPLLNPGTSINLGGGTHGLRRFEASHAMRLNDRLGLNVAGFYAGQNGFMRNQATGQRADKQDEAGARLRLVWNANERLSLDYIANYEFTKQNGFPYGVVSPQTHRAASPDQNVQGTYRRQLFTTGINLKYDLTNAEIHSSTSYQHLHDNMLMDIDYTSRDFQLMRQRQNQNALTEELTIKSKPGTSKYEWANGLFFSKKWLETIAPVEFGNDWGTTVSTPIETAMYNAMINSMAASIKAGMIAGGMTEPAAEMASRAAAAAAIEGAGGVKMDPAELSVPGRFKTPQTNFGLFHQSTLHIGPRFTATAGLRYDMSHVGIDFQTSGAMALTAHVMGKDATNVLSSALNRHASDTYHQLLTRLAFTYDLDSQGSNIYASLSKGYRAGGFNIQNFSDIFSAEFNNPENKSKVNKASYDIPHDDATYKEIISTISYEPETSWNYEVGTHLNLFDGALQIDASAYYIQVRNLQLSQMASNYSFGRSMVNAGRSRSLGLEFALRGRAFDNAFSYGLNYGLTRADFRDYNDQVDGVDISYRGKRVPYIPMHTLTANADYRFSLKCNTLQAITLGANVAGQGKIYWDEANTQSQKFYATLGAHLDFELQHVTVSLWGSNITNTKYNVFAFRYGHSGTAPFFGQKANPAQGGIDLRLHF